jgi:hypothetical protein
LELETVNAKHKLSEVNTAYLQNLDVPLPKEESDFHKDKRRLFPTHAVQSPQKGRSKHRKKQYYA